MRNHTPSPRRGTPPVSGGESYLPSPTLRHYQDFSRVERVERVPEQGMGLWLRWLVDREIGKLVVGRWW